MKRKHPEIDVIELMAGTNIEFSDETRELKHETEDDTAIHNTLTKKISQSHIKWNEWLTKCDLKNDLEDLIRVRYGIQVGMDSAAKKKLNDAHLCEMFCRWTGSIDRVVRRIIKKKYPIPVVNKIEDIGMQTKLYARKKKVDHELEIFLRRNSF